MIQGYIEWLLAIHVQTTVLNDLLFLTSISRKLVWIYRVCFILLYAELYFYWAHENNIYNWKKTAEIEINQVQISAESYNPFNYIPTTEKQTGAKMVVFQKLFSPSISKRAEGFKSV